MQLWWRLKTFLKLWWHLFASGESRWAWVRKLISRLIFLGTLGYIAWDVSVLIFLQAPTTPLINVRFGLLIFIVAAVAWALLTAGRAYEQAGVPDLIVDNELIYDQGNYRLFLTSKQKGIKTKVWLQEIVNADNEPIVSHGRFPLEMEWTNHAEELDIVLPRGRKQSISVALVKRQSGNPAELWFTGARNGGEVRFNKGESAYIHLLIEHPRRNIERWFRFERVNDISFEVSPDAPLGITKQASA